MNPRFPGLWLFIDRARNGRTVPHIGRARDIWHVRQLADVMSLAARTRDGQTRKSLLRHAGEMRDSLKVVLDGIDAAIEDLNRGGD